jgi:DnaJ-class molecular chaperone
MMKGKMSCPICAGTGKLYEDSAEYEFQTRDPHSETCLTCSGTGEVGIRQKLPDGRYVCDLEPKAAKKQPKAKVPSGVHKMVNAFNAAPTLRQMMADLESGDVAEVERIANQHEFILAKVMLIKLSGSRENVTNSIIDLFESL